MRSVLAPTLLLCLIGCDAAGPGSFPPEDPALAASNEAAGDPWRGRFPFEEAVAGLPEEGHLRATIVTGEGEVHCRLYADVAPLGVANFVGLARGLRPFFDPEQGGWVTRPFYDGSSFHRAVERQFVQGGRLGQQDSVGFLLQDERSIGTVFDSPGVLALANQGQPHTSAVEFFITTAALPQLDGKYTIIGHCDEPLVVRAIEASVRGGAEVAIEAVRIDRER